MCLVFALVLGFLVGCDELPEIAALPAPFSPGGKPVECVVDGIDFGGHDDLEWTPFSGKNFLMNGGFESKARYWRNLHNGLNVRNYVYDREAHTGKYSLRITNNVFVASHGYAAKPGKKYTISWWHKRPAGEKGRFGSQIVTWSANAQKGPKGEPHPGHRADAKDEWTRASFSFVWAETSISMRVSGNALIDDIRLFEGEDDPSIDATAEGMNPFGLELKTSEGEGRCYCDSEKPVSIALEVTGKSGATGVADISVTDFFKRTIKTMNGVVWTIGDDGTVELPLWDYGVFPRRGLFDIRVHFRPEGAQPHVDHFRFASYRFADGTAPTRFLHQMPSGAFGTNQDEFRRQMLSLGVAFRRSATGSCYPEEWQPKGKKFYYNYRKWDADREAAGARQMLEIGGYNFGRCMFGHGTADFIMKVRWNIDNPADMEHISPEVAEKIEEAVAEVVRTYPWVTVWVSPNEVMGHWNCVKKGRFDDYARALIAMQNGIRKVNPKAVFLAYSTCNIGEQGRREIFNAFEAAQRLIPGYKFDAVDVHTYRPHPENPDLDEDIKTFTGMLAKLGYDESFQIWAIEGCYYYPMIEPKWNNVAPWGSTADKDRFSHMGAPGYALGWGERASAAMYLRDKLILLRHFPQVQAGTCWGFDCLDPQNVLAPLLTASVMTELLGRATFLEDVRFAPNARAYVFDDHDGHAVAAFWKADVKMDMGLHPAETIALDAGILDGVEIFDMMGEKCKVEKRGGGGQWISLPLSQCPVFLRLPIERSGDIAKALNASVISGAKDMPVGFEFKMQNLTELKISVENPLTRSFAGMYAFADGKAQSLTLGSRERKTIDYVFDKPLSFDEINTVAFPMTVVSGDSASTNAYKFNVLPVRYSKGKPDWTKLPLVPIKYRKSEKAAIQRGEFFGGDEDLSGGFKLAWNEDHLYIRFEITDDKYAVKVAPQDVPYPGNWWANDGIQMFFDTLGDGPMKKIRGISGFDGNDMSYDIMTTNETHGLVYRRHVPDHQLTGGVLGGLLGNRVEPGVACSYNYDAATHLRTVELDFPAELLRPMRLAPGSTPGFAVKVQDRDDPEPGDPWRAGTKGFLTNIDPKVGDAFGTMHEYATMLFVSE